MSTYNGGRRGPNVSQFVRDLNTIHDPEESYGPFEDDLALFTNSQFFDIETGQTTADFQPAKMVVDRSETEQTAPPDEATSASTALGDLSGMDFISGDFNFPEFSTYTSPTLGTYGDSLGNLQSLPHAPESVYSPTSQHPPGYNAAGQPLPHLAEKRKGSEASGHQRLLAFNADEAARIAAEEDKRRRNTAASARFRIKKKQREQALERSAKEMTEKVTLLESRISQLETENKWLKNLITEKNGGDDITSQWREFKEQAAAKAAKESNAASSTASSSETSKPEADK